MTNGSRISFLFPVLLVVGAVSFIIFSLAVVSQKQNYLPEKQDCPLDVKDMLQQELGIELPDFTNAKLIVDDINNDRIKEFIVGFYSKSASYICVLSNGSVLWKQEFSGNIVPFTVGDMESDGLKEIIILEPGENLKLSVYDFSGNLIWDNVFGEPPYPQLITPALMDMDNDGILDIVTVGEKEILAFSTTNPTPLISTQTDLNLGKEDTIISLGANPATNDVIIGTNSGKIFIAGNQPISPKYTDHIYEDFLIKHPEFVVENAVILWPLGINIIGYQLNGPPLFGDANAILLSEKTVGPAIVDLKTDGKLEIAAAAIDGTGYVFSMDGKPLSGWPRNVSTPIPIYTKPIVFETNILFVSSDGKIRGYGMNGKPIEKLKGDVEETVITQPILTDLDDDGYLELVVLTLDGKIHTLSLGEDAAIPEENIMGTMPQEEITEQISMPTEEETSAPAEEETLTPVEERATTEEVQEKVGEEDVSIPEEIVEEASAPAEESINTEEVIQEPKKPTEYPEPSESTTYVEEVYTPESQVKFFDRYGREKGGDQETSEEEETEQKTKEVSAPEQQTKKTSVPIPINKAETARPTNARTITAKDIPQKEIPIEQITEDISIKEIEISEEPSEQQKPIQPTKASVKPQIKKSTAKTITGLKTIPEKPQAQEQTTKGIKYKINAFIKKLMQYFGNKPDTQ